MKCRNDKRKHHYIELEKPQRLREEFLRKYNYTIADFSENKGKSAVYPSGSRHLFIFEEHFEKLMNNYKKDTLNTNPTQWMNHPK